MSYKFIVLKKIFQYTNTELALICPQTHSILSSYWSTLSILSYDWLQVRDATLAVSRVDDYGASARLLSATTLRNVLGTKSLEVTHVTRHICTRAM